MRWQIPIEYIVKCPFFIMVPEHYREDGTCKCDDPEHRRMMIREWGYAVDDFKNIPLRKEKEGVGFVSFCDKKSSEDHQK